MLTAGSSSVRIDRRTDRHQDARSDL